MLTIHNIYKLFRRDVRDWRISRVETINTAYLIHLRKPTGESMQVNLERNIIEGNAYELWCWKDGMNGTFPERLVLPIERYRTPEKTIENIALLLM